MRGVHRHHVFNFLDPFSWKRNIGNPVKNSLRVLATFCKFQIFLRGWPTLSEHAPESISYPAETLPEGIGWSLEHVVHLTCKIATLFVIHLKKSKLKKKVQQATGSFITIRGSFPTYALSNHGKCCQTQSHEIVLLKGHRGIHLGQELCIWGMKPNPGPRLLYLELFWRLLLACESLAQSPRMDSGQCSRLNGLKIRGISWISIVTWAHCARARSCAACDSAKSKLFFDSLR
jgi:hypothetical protein